MEQIALPLLGRLEGAAIVPPSLLRNVKSYRQAVRLCWALRRIRNMTQRHLAAVAGLRPQLVSDYLHPDDRPTRRNLPGEQIKDFEDVCGNAAISQWIASRQRLTVLEELQAERAA